PPLGLGASTIGSGSVISSTPAEAVFFLVSAFAARALAFTRGGASTLAGGASSTSLTCASSTGFATDGSTGFATDGGDCVLPTVLPALSASPGTGAMASFAEAGSATGSPLLPEPFSEAVASLDVA